MASIEFYTKKSGRLRYFQVRDSRNRLGAQVPVDTWRRLPDKTKFHSESDLEFDDTYNFSCAKLGELASPLLHDKGECKNETFGKNLICHVFG